MGEVFTLSVPASSSYLKAVRAFFKSVLPAFCGDETDRVVLALDECCSNVVKHRDSGPRDDPVEVRAELERGLARFRIKDFCCPEDVQNIKPRRLDDVRPGGLGTHFVGEIMDAVRFEADPDNPDRMILVLEKKLKGPERI